MIVEITVPSPGESVSEVILSAWLKADGDIVQKDEELFEIESEKATLAVSATASGKLAIRVPAGESVRVGEVACTIDTSVAAPAAGGAPPPAPARGAAEREPVPHEAVSAPQPVVPPSAPPSEARSEMPAAAPVPAASATRATRRQKLSALRLKAAERLVAVKNQTAMLTTFNEVDMTAIQAARAKYRERFQQKYSVSLGLMPFFVKAVCEAIRDFPAVNAFIEQDEIVYHDYVDMGIAVSAPKGLVVPVIRNAESLSFERIEAEVERLAQRARTNQLTLDEMSGGTFTITNGGVFGSLLSTPLLNPPQSGILGMHNIVRRPVAVGEQIEIRPMMYLAFSYDHRIIDGRESVGFLVRVKELLEDPLRLLLSA